METWPFVASASVPPPRRVLRLGRRRAYHVPTLGHLLMLEAFCPLVPALLAVERGALQDPALLQLAGLLSWPWRKTQRLIGTRRFALRCWLARPRTLGEAFALCLLVRDSTETPPRFRDADAKPAPFHAPASSAAMRLAVRAERHAAVICALAGVRTVLDAPARDVIAWLLAEDELEGAHFLDYETNRKIEEAENGTGQA